MLNQIRRLQLKRIYKLYCTWITAFYVKAVIKKMKRNEFVIS